MHKYNILKTWIAVKQKQIPSAVSFSACGAAVMDSILLAPREPL